MFVGRRFILLTMSWELPANSPLNRSEMNMKFCIQSRSLSFLDVCSNIRLPWYSVMMVSRNKTRKISRDHCLFKLICLFLLISRYPVILVRYTMDHGLSISGSLLQTKYGHVANYDRGVLRKHQNSYPHGMPNNCLWHLFISQRKLIN